MAGNHGSAVPVPLDAAFRSPARLPLVGSFLAPAFFRCQLLLFYCAAVLVCLPRSGYHGGMTLQLFNSDGRQLQDFVPHQLGHATMYCCGPTVYAVAHLGNLRAYVCQDLLRRTLQLLGFQVRHVRNITDVGHLSDDGDEGEDKMLRSAREAGMDVWQIAQYFSDIFARDCSALNILPPHQVCRATEHIGQMISLISQLEQRGYAYLAAGNVYFDTSRLGEDYGRLVGLHQQDLHHGKRISVDQHKRSSSDFVLWFTAGKFEHQAMQWDSPWGRGYPGWHIECSAMAMFYLGDKVDIHCGGIDHLAVHHTNEIAQSEAALGHRWVNYWMHNEFLLWGEEKMAKSEGNVFNLEQLQHQGYHPLDYRYLLLSGHYRSQLRFSPAAMQAARNGRQRLQGRLQQLVAEAEGSADVPQEYWLQFQSALCRDLNSPQALALLWQALKDDALSAGARVQLAQQCDQVLALDLLAPSSCQQLPAELEALWQQRQQARAQRNYQLADQLRDQLLQAGIAVKDGPEGSSWRRL